jgi:hypothetical protein
MKRCAIALFCVLLASSAAAQTVVGTAFRLNTGPCTERSGSGTPEGAVVGVVCDTYHQTNSPYDLWRKTSGTGNTGWVKDSVVGGLGNVALLDAANTFTAANPIILGGVANGTMRTDTAGYFTVQAGTSGYRWHNNANNTVLMSLTNAGVFAVNGQGIHEFASTTNTFQIVRSATSSAGTAARALFRADAGAVSGNLATYSEGYTTSGINLQGSVLLSGDGLGGLGLGATNSSGAIRFYPGGTALRGMMHASGGFSWGTSSDPGVDNVAVGANVNPAFGYVSNLGSLQKKYLTLHAAELWVETLVAQNTLATIGGRVLVAPTNLLTADFAAAATTIPVKYNNFANGDRVYMEADGKVEFMAVTSGASGSAGAYTYTVTRNLDGSGANDWFAGDAVLNTGQAGNGFIDLYSVRGIRAGTEVGPTIAGNVRNSSTYNDWTPRWAIGNLDGLYGYSGSTYGAAFGVPSAAWIKIDPTNGIRIGHNVTTFTQIDASGNASFTGTITAGAGAIGGWSIGADFIRDAADSTGMASTVTGGDDVRFWAGGSFANRATAPFRVTEAGVLTANNATIVGTITATLGAIGGWSIGATTLSATNITLTSGAANTANILAGTGANAGGINSGNSSTDVVFWAGSTHANRTTAPFRVLGNATTTIATLNSTAIDVASFLQMTSSGYFAGTSFVNFNGTIQSGTGFVGRAGTAGAVANPFNIQWDASCARIWIDTSDLGCIAIASDERLKQDFTPYTGAGALAAIQQLTPGTFQWAVGVDRTTRQVGLRAQEVRKVLPLLVRNNGMVTAETPDGMLQVDYVAMVPVLVRALQELSEEVDRLKARAR